MLFLAVTIFPVIAIGCGLVSLVAVTRFVSQIQQDIQAAKRK